MDKPANLTLKILDSDAYTLYTDWQDVTGLEARQWGGPMQTNTFSIDLSNPNILKVPTSIILTQTILKVSAELATLKKIFDADYLFFTRCSTTLFSQD